jgi:adenylyl cyclase-associated protein
LQGVFADAKAFGVDAQFSNHSKSVNEGLQICQWVLMAPPASLPADYAGEMIGASDFWANKLRMEHKNTDGGAPHIEFAKAFKELMQGLVAYIKDNHKTGVSWNFQGQDIDSYSGGGASTPVAAPAAPKAKAAASSKGPAGGGLADVFAGIKSIDQSSGKTAGLNAVREDQQTWRANYAGGAKQAPVRKAPVKKEEKPTKPPVCELQRDKWVIENQVRGFEVQ